MYVTDTSAKHVSTTSTKRIMFLFIGIGDALSAFNFPHSLVDQVKLLTMEVAKKDKALASTLVTLNTTYLIYNSTYLIAFVCKTLLNILPQSL